MAVQTAGVRDAAIMAVEAALAEADLPVERPKPDAYVVKLPGEHKLWTTVSLVVGDHTLSLNAFVARRPDENFEGVYRWLLERNARLGLVAFALDHLGDVYLVGRLPLHAVTKEDVDQMLGDALNASDESFDVLLELGFAGAIRREWAWRVSRGESLQNLAAFAHMIETDDADGAAAPAANDTSTVGANGATAPDVNGATAATANAVSDRPDAGPTGS